MACHRSFFVFLSFILSFSFASVVSVQEDLAKAKKQAVVITIVSLGALYGIYVHNTSQSICILYLRVSLFSLIFVHFLIYLVEQLEAAAAKKKQQEAEKAKAAPAPVPAPPPPPPAAAPVAKKK